jgi:hypothetical protein
MIPCDAFQFKNKHIRCLPTSENIDEDALDLGVRQQDFKCLLDSLGGGTSVSRVRQGSMEKAFGIPSDVQEISRVTAMKRKDVHGSHGQTGTID